MASRGIVAVLAAGAALRLALLAAPSIALEGSEDGTTWRPIAAEASTGGRLR